MTRMLRQPGPTLTARTLIGVRSKWEGGTQALISANVGEGKIPRWKGPVALGLGISFSLRHYFRVLFFGASETLL